MSGAASANPGRSPLSNWDYIVVGAGSAGCALTHELVKANKTVLVLEAGGSDRSPVIRFPAGAIIAEQKFDWGYKSQPDPSCNGATEAWTRGRVLGGSSSVNSTVFVRGAAHDFDRWAAANGGALQGWSSKEIMPIFRELESSDCKGVLRGQDGPLHVRTVRKPHLLTDAFIQSASKCGHGFNADYNGERQEGIAYAQLSQQNGLRCSSADAFLRPLLGKRENLSLMLNAWAQKIEFADGRATGISFLHQGRLKMECARNVVVCSGAVNSPQLLMLSGIGDPQELRRHDIKPVAALPGVGRNLQDHPSIRLLYRSRVRTYNLTGGLLQKLGFLSTYLRTREGPISNLYESVAFLKSSHSEPYADVQVHFGPVGLIDDREGCSLAPFPSASVIVNKSYPLGRGRIRLASADATVPPLIECRLLGEEADVDTLAQSLLMIRNIAQTHPLADLIECEPVIGPTTSHLDSLKAYVRDHAKTTYHPIGTCRMGIDEDAVVGPDLRVRGVDNLWVADASVMPDLISGNTNAVCIMIGRKLGKQLAAVAS